LHKKIIAISLSSKNKKKYFKKPKQSFDLAKPNNVNRKTGYAKNKHLQGLFFKKTISEWKKAFFYSK
jgi:hypothetical protein